jgi:aspartate kinase
MKVFKFGGASINSIERIKNTTAIIQSYKHEQLFIIVSAMGKTTNELEKVVAAFFAGNKEEALKLFDNIKNSHNAVAEALGVSNEAALIIKDIYTEIEWLLHDKPVRDYDYYYDQIVCSGELLSTAIISSYLQANNSPNKWIDVRDIFRTDDNFRDANIDWAFTKNKVETDIIPMFSETNIILTQGFIGSTDENESTTLGREGSDYSAAIFANMLDAESQTIWKDVEGVMNADPKKFAEAIIINELSFNEVIEMAYYGAQVIHPKTIKPLQNKNIPLHVKCFLDPTLAGTIISAKPVHHLPPIIVVKEKQVLIELQSKDFSFISETGISNLYSLFDTIKITPNVTQNGAISLLCCFDDKPEKIEKFALAASNLFEVKVQKNISLLTIRYYTKDLIDNMTSGKEILLTQQTPNTIQLIIKDAVA